MQHKRNLSLIPVLLLMFSTAVAEDSEGIEHSPEGSIEENSFLDLDLFEEGAVLSDAELNTHRARQNFEVDQVTINAQDQDADVSENIAVGNNTGQNLIQGEAYSNSTGFMSTVQNTGNNVLIQNSTIINVSMDTPTN